MRGNELLDKMELVEPAFVEEADKEPLQKKKACMKWNVIAACIGLFVLVGILLFSQETEENSLAKITVPDLVCDMGYEGHMWHDISEYSSGSPWKTEMELTALPVFRNGSYDASGAGIPKGMTREEMTELLNQISGKLDLKVLDFQEEYSPDYSTEGNPDVLTEIRAVTDYGEITVRADGAVSYDLPDEGFEIPKEYFAGVQASDEEVRNTIEFLSNQYTKLLGFEEIAPVSWGEYTFSGEFFRRRFFAYDSSGDDVTDLLNYYFNQTDFLINFDGRLSGIRINHGLSLAEKIDDYPIISVEDAINHLLEGNYQTTVSYEMPEREAIAKIELGYRTGPLEETFLPYYIFYILLPQDSDVELADGLNMYGVYYVPAIEGKYIENMPVYQ